MEKQRLIIANRFNGPPGMGNGGYVSGRIAALLDADVTEVTLRAPCPLDTALDIAWDDGTVGAWDSDRLILRARPGHLSLETPHPVDPRTPGCESWTPALADAEAVRGQFRDANPFPTCFVCGHERIGEPGLEIQPGVLRGGDLVAAPWTPPSEFADDGAVDATLVWAALDCPSGWANALAGPMVPMVLGRLTVQIHHPVPVGEPTVVGGWHLARQGRKSSTACALWVTDGTVLAGGDDLDTPATLRFIENGGSRKPPGWAALVWCSAVTYSPTRFPVQYHRRWRA